MLKLYYVRGLNRVDTPLFVNYNQRSTYFATRLVDSINPSVDDNDFYYPPKYEDNITLTYDEIGDKEFNYLSLTFRNKEFFYFVDRIEYINEEVVSVQITLDTLVTYMPDIVINTGIIKRRCIKRWNTNGTINRDYIRENISEGVFKVHTYAEHTTNTDGYIVATCTKKPEGTTITGYVDSYRNPDINIVVPMSTFVYVHPTTGSYLNKIGLMARIPETENIYYLPFNPFYSTPSTEVTIDIEGFSPDNVTMKWSSDYRLNIKSHTIFKDFFTQNVDRARPFDWQYCPQLMDENYLDIGYGERDIMAHFPLYETDLPTLYGKYYADLLSGRRYYYITPDTTETYNHRDIQQTMVSASPTRADLVYNAVAQYNTGNRGTFEGLANRLIGSDNIDPLGIVGGLGIGSQLMQSQHPMEDISTGVQRHMNRVLSPEHTRSTGNYGGDLSMKLGVVTSVLKVKSDIEDIALTFESKGYKVHQYVASTTLNTLRTRYYYNYFEFDDLSVFINENSNETALIDDIKKRFMEGVRLWSLIPTGADTLIPLGLYGLYDNVEI